MGMGVPILMSLPEGEATGIVRATDSGVCVPPEDPAAMADAIRRLASDPHEVARLAGNGRAAAPAFSREARAAQMLAILEQAAGIRRTPD
jgi:colanic acid biosynthesis glycosyl transferase WcaI